MAESATLSNHLVSICNRALEQRLSEDPDFIESYRTCKEQLKDLKTICQLKDDIRILTEENDAARQTRRLDEKKIEHLTKKCRELSEANMDLARRLEDIQDQQCSMQNRTMIVREFIEFLEKELT